MKKTAQIFIVILFVFISSANAKKEGKELLDSLNLVLSKSKEDTNKVRLLHKISGLNRSEDPKKAIEIDKTAYELSKKLNYNFGIARSLNSIGIGYYFLGEYVNALSNWQDSKTYYTKIGDTRGVANILSNMGAIYFNQSDYTNAVKLYLEALKIAEQNKDTLRIASVWQNIGAVHNEKGELDLAINAYAKAIPLFESIQNNEGTGLAVLNRAECLVSQNKYSDAKASLLKSIKLLSTTSYYATALRVMGEVLLKTDGFNTAYPLLDSALKVANNSGDNFEATRAVNSLAKAFEQKGDLVKALAYFEKGKELTLSTDKYSSELIISASGLVRLNAKKGDYKKAFENQKLLQEVKDSVFTLESDKKITRLLFNFDLEKKENEIAILVKDNKIQEIEVDRQKGIRNGFISGFIVVLVFSVVVFKQRNNISKEKKRSEELLLNILPSEVAEELKAKGEAEAKLIENATVLFTDFKGFTALSESLSPKELVKDLHECFTAFDHIIQKYGMEKIKTIGDSYMAAGGLPSPNNTHPEDVIKAAFEIVQFIEEGKAKKILNNQQYFEIRIGIHTGPVVAGIVGVKKFSYDIWGDTVNTASRIESSGEVGRVNISGSTYELVKDKFTCVHRGKIPAKGKGDIDMYFVTSN